MLTMFLPPTLTPRSSATKAATGGLDAPGMARSLVLLDFDAADERPVGQVRERAFEEVAFDGEFEDEVIPAGLDFADERLLLRVVDEVERAHRLGLAVDELVRRDGHGVRLAARRADAVDDPLVVAGGELLLVHAERLARPVADQFRDVAPLSLGLLILSEGRV